MAVNVRRSSCKRITDPFNEKIRARIFGTSSTSSSTSSSGSEHDGDNDLVSPSHSHSPSPCLSHLVLNFLEDNSATATVTATTTATAAATESSRGCDSDSDSEDFVRSDPAELIDSVINPAVRSNADAFRNQLLNQVVRAVEIFSIFKKNKSIYNRNLMAYLRQIGYNAAVCKTNWKSSGGLTAGNFEFIDVTRPDSAATRYLIDADFAAEFEMARETASYEKVRSALPRVFVGKPEDLKRIVRLMSDEARRSMKINGLTLPPWRKNRYMQAKWLGPYRRTTNPLPAAQATMAPNFSVKCRSVGFDLGGDDGGCGRVFVPPVSRTR